MKPNGKSMAPAAKRPKKAVEVSDNADDDDDDDDDDDYECSDDGEEEDEYEDEDDEVDDEGNGEEGEEEEEPPQRGRAYQQAREQDAADDEGAGEEGEEDEATMDDRAIRIATLKQQKQNNQTMKELLNFFRNGGAPAAPAAPAAHAAHAAHAAPPGAGANDIFVPMIGQRSFGQLWRGRVVNHVLRVTILRISDELEFQDVAPGAMIALGWQGRPAACLKPFRTAVQNIRRDVHSDLVTTLRDQYMLHMPNIIHRAMPNANKAPVLAQYAKSEHLGLFDELIGPYGNGFTLDGADRYMFKFHAAMGTGVNAGRLVACGNPEVTLDRPR